ncbi:hypothetical protein BVX99_02695 [bacterium F16]|nr:hypothetical protein BVX99_02695 [bacterium F16]
MTGINRFSLLLIVLTCIASAYADDAYIVLKNGEKVIPANNRMGADGRGTVLFTDIVGKKHSYSRGQIKFIANDCPNSIITVEKLFRYQRYDDVIKAVDSLSSNDVYLGWGAFAFYLKGMAQIQLNKLDDADTTFKKTVVLAMAEERDDLLKNGLKIVQMLKGSANVPSRVSSFNLLLQGIAYEKKKKYRESALEYMKAVKLFPVNDKQGTDLERLLAMARLVDVLKAGNDKGTSLQFAEAMKSEM